MGKERPYLISDSKGLCESVCVLRACAKRVRVLYMCDVSEKSGEKRESSFGWGVYGRDRILRGR